MLLGNALCNVKVTELHVRYAYKQLAHKLIAQRLAGWHSELQELHAQGSLTHNFEAIT